MHEIEARAGGYARIGLSVFRDVPFNAPFYTRPGFAIIAPETVSEVIRARFEREIPAGVGMHDRVLMICELPEFRESAIRLT